MCCPTDNDITPSFSHLLLWLSDRRCQFYIVRSSLGFVSAGFLSQLIAILSSLRTPCPVFVALISALKFCRRFLASITSKLFLCYQLIDTGSLSLFLWHCFSVMISFVAIDYCRFFIAVSLLPNTSLLVFGAILSGFIRYFRFVVTIFDLIFIGIFIVIYASPIFVAFLFLPCCPSYSFHCRRFFVAV